MVTIADFVGVWYVNGDKKKPARITLYSTHLRLQVGGSGTSCSFDGVNEISNGSYGHGVLSSDLRRIAWTNGIYFER